MTTIHDAYINALLADASYVDALTNANLEAQLTGRMTPGLAKYIATNFELVRQVGGLASSFDAAVWSDKTTRQTYVSMRGTQDFPADYQQDVNLAISGLPYEQLADMVNWWLRATTNGQALQIQVRTTLIPGPGFLLPIKDFVQAQAVQGTGELASISAITSVNGHSLGGYLATAFVRLFGKQWPVASINTFNSAGFSRLETTHIDSGFNQIAQLIGPALGFPSFSDAQNNYFGENGVNAATNTWNPIGFRQYGTRVGLFQEDLASAFSMTSPFYNNHSMYKLTDLLALGDALEQLDRTMDVAKLSRLVSGGSNQMVASYESLLDALRRLFFGSNVERTLTGDANAGNAGPQPEARLDYHAKLRSLITSTTFKDAVSSNAVTIDEFAGLTASQLFARARGTGTNGLAYRYALNELNSFAVLGPDSIYAAHDGTLLAPYDAATRAGVLTDEWLNDRIGFAQARVAANLVDQPSVVIPGQTDNWRYIDVAANVDVTAFGAAPASIRRYAVFGGGDADKLEGRSEADHLYAAAGTDYLVGHGGNDYVEGGTGLDLYQFNSGQRLTTTGIVTGNDGQDEIRDIDGVGVLRYAYTPLFDSAQSAVIVDTSMRLDNGTWQSADGKFSYAMQGADLLITINVNGGGSITLRDFRQGDFGIYLWDSRAEPITERTLEGDLRPFEPTVYDSWGNVARTGDPSVDREDGLFGRDDGVGDLVIGGGGNDLIFGDTPAMSVPGPRRGFDPLQSGGADRLQGDSGRDIIDGGPGNDLVEGGLGGAAAGDDGGDLIQGGLGDDALYGDFRIDLGSAIRNGETDIPSSLKGDFVSGGAGKDWIIGSTAKDLLMGGGDRDVLVGGAGDDTIFSDDGVTATTYAWIANRTESQQDGQTVYDVNITGGNFVDFSEGGADVVYAGAGKDWVWSQVGNDFIDGGSGDDVLFGGYGSDVVLGGAGSDVLVGDEGAANAAEGGDYLDGGDGNDTLYGNGGDDILVGGRGNDKLVGGPGKDVYVYEKGDGRDTIDDSDVAGGASSVIHFGPGLARADVKFGLGSLKMTFGGDEELHVAGFDRIDPASTPVIGELQFDDGQVMTYADVLAQGFDVDGTDQDDDGDDPEHPMLIGTGVVDRISGFSGNDVLAGLGGDDILNGGAGADELQGGEGNDHVIGDGIDPSSAEQGNDLLFGGAGDDVLQGDGGNDQLHGDQGDDLLVAGLGDDYVAGDLGDDRLFGDSGTDTLLGGEGNDFAAGGEGNDAIAGEAGDDELFGGVGNDGLEGGDGADQLSGNDGSDLLDGGKGDDVLFGGAGNDIYVFNQGDGRDYIDDKAGTNTVRFGPGITQASLHITRTGTSSQGYVFITYGTDSTITIKDGASASTIQSYQFADGSVRTQAQILGAALPVPAGTVYPLYGTSSDDFLSPGIAGDFRIYGNAGNDTIFGGSGSDRIDGGGDDDTLNGLGGSNTYVVGHGSGHDTITNAFSGGNDTLEFAPDILAQDVQITHEPNGDLRLRITGSGDDVTVSDFFGAFPSHLEAIRYGDGTLEDLQSVRELEIAPIGAADDGTVTGTEFDDTLLGDLGANVLDGQGGSDLLQGDSGADVYVVKPGMGRDTIVDDGEGDILKLGPGLAFRHLTAARQGNDLLVGILGTEDGALLKDYYVTSQPWHLEDDAGESQSLAEFLAEAATSSSEDSVDQARDAWLAGIRNFALSELGGYSPVSGNLALQSDGEFQNYYAVRVRSSASNSPRISNLYHWHDVGDLGDFGIPPVVRTVVNVEVSAEHISLQPASGGTGGFGNGFDSQFLVDYDRTDAEGNPLVIGTPDGSGHWSASYAQLQALSPQTSSEQANTTVTVPVTVEQTNSVSGLTAELISGGAGNNLFTVFGFVAIDAGAGDDVLNATGWLFWERGSPAGGNFLYGADGNDRIFGTDAPDVLIGGNGVDYLAGTGGHDTYKIFAGDTGKKVIDESVVHYSLPNSFVSGWSNSGWFSRDVVEFSSGIELNNLQFEWGQFDSTTVDDSGEGRRYRTLNLSWAPGKEVKIVLPDSGNSDVGQRTADYPGQSYGVEQFKFADGTVVAMDDLLARATAAIGAPDPTRYAFKAGDGSQTLGDLNGLSAVDFGPGIEPASLLVSGRAGDDVFLRLDASDSLRIKDWFAAQSVDLRFGDGTVWDAAVLGSLPVLIVGTDDADTLFAPEGGENILLGLHGDDQFFGASGNDTYAFGRGDGADSIYDHAYGPDAQMNTVSFTADVALDDVGVTRDDAGNLYLVVNQDGGRVVLSGGFDEDGSGKAFRARFADGAEWSAAELESRVTPLPATLFGDVLAGTDGDDVELALAGDDLLFGMAGNDLLDGGVGADRLEGGSGFDILRGGADADVIHDPDGRNLIDGGAGDDWLNADSATINFWIGGGGADNLEMNGGVNNIVAFNRGDGEDSIPVWFANNQPLTLSVGGGITLADLAFVQEGADIVVDAGAGDRAHLSFWYFNFPHAETRLQLITEGRIDVYDLVAAVEHWEANGGLGSEALQANHLSTWTDQAFGGALAYEYATTGGLAAMSAPVIRSFLTGEQFGISPQPIAFERDQAPALVSPIADQSANEDSPFEFTVPAGTFTVQEGATYEATLASGESLPAWLHFDPATVTFSGTPAQGDVRTIDVRLTATVGGLSADDTFGINVANVNDAPRASGSLGPRAATQDQPFAFVIPEGAFTDEDPGDHLSFAASGLPAWLAFDPVARSFSGTPGNADVGTATIEVTARDDAGASVSSSFDLEVTNVNDVPTPADDLASVAEDGVLEAAGDVLSNDGDIDAGTRLEVRSPGPLQGRYGTLDLAADGAFRYALNNASPIVQSLRGGEIVFDDFGYAAWDGMASAPATLRVSIAGRNDAPITVTDVAATAEDVNPVASGNVLANDSDVDVGSSLLVANAGTYEDPATRLGRLTLHADGSYEYALDNAAAQALGDDEVVHEHFSYVASDGYVPGVDEVASDRASGILDVAIHGANDAPSVSALLADLFATEDQPLEYLLPVDAFTDIDRQDELTYAASRSDGTRLPDWLSFDQGTRTLRGTPANGDVGLTSLQVVATDRAGASTAQSFVVAVANVNDAPTVANDIPDQFVEAGTALYFAVPQSTFHDVDVGDALTLSAGAIGGGALPSWLKFNPSTASFSGTPQSTDIGVFGVEVHATDGSGASASSEFALAVTAKAGTSVRGGAGADVIFGSTGNETLSAGGGGDALFGLGGNDVLRGGKGNDVMQGGEGADVLHGGKGNNVLDGGSGSDAIFDGAGSAFIAGGTGADTIRVGGGSDVISYNRGDGSDTIIGGGDGGNTLSLGGGIRYSDLYLSKAGRDLIVNTGGEDRITLKDWYGAGGNHSLLTLQMIVDASEDFDTASSDPLRNNRVETFDFLGLVRAFDQARVQSPGLTSWALTNALLQFHLAGSDDAALGGDLAYWYGKRGKLEGMSLQAAQQVIGAAGFGADAQQLHPFTGLQDGLVKLG